MLSKKLLLGRVKYIIDHSQYVSINVSKISEFTKNFMPQKVTTWNIACPFLYKQLNADDEIDFRFIANSQAFCFWGYPQKWTITYQGKKLDGWWALLVSLKRALEEGVPLLDANFLAKVTVSAARKIFKGVPEIPLLKERVAILNEIGNVLGAKYNGRFHNLYQSSSRNALDLLQKIVNEFPLSFDDTSKFNNKKVFFYKKAQLLTLDIMRVYGDTSISGLDQLIGKADYKIPALLRNQGILEYNNQLANIVDSRKEILKGSAMEVEIRAHMLYITHLISQKLKQKYPALNEMEVDSLLWFISQQKSKTGKPYHLTRTTAY